MQLVTSGLMNKQIAAEVRLSEITVKIHRGHIMKKMTARTLPDLVRMAEALKGICLKAPGYKPDDSDQFDYRRRQVDPADVEPAATCATLFQAYASQAREAGLRSWQS